MNIRGLSPSGIVSAAINVGQGFIELTQSQIATQILPGDVTFAVVVDLLERSEEESFRTLTLSPLGADLRTDSPLQASIVGYLALTEKALRIYKDGTLYSETPLSNIRVTSENASYVIHFLGKKYKIVGMQAVHGSVPFASNASGKNQGYGALFDQMQAGGAQVTRRSIAPTIIFISVFVIIFFGIVVGILISSH